MKRMLPVVLLVVGCSGAARKQNPDTKDEKAAKSAFETWVKHVANGEAEAVFRGMSSRMVSDWLFTRLIDTKDAWMKDQRNLLRGLPSEELEIWLVHNRSTKYDRPTMLPSSVMRSPWLLKVFSGYVRLGGARLRDEYSKLRVSLVAVDGVGATIMARNEAYGGTDQYVLVYEGGWKIDSHKEPLQHRPK